jgi:hypothetical protein
MMGRFDRDHRVLQSQNPALRWEMTSTRRGYFQTATIEKGGKRLFERAERMDIIIGSGKIGQTYLFWDGSRLYQLPISYFTQGEGWAYSPGYADGEVNFGRPIVTRCLECHATYIESASYTDNRYGKKSYVLGVSCERCHGLGADHEAYHRASPTPVGPDPIVNPVRLDRQAQFDVCNQCHAGVGTPLGAPFSYSPGDVLEEHIKIDWRVVKKAAGVHASGPYARLSKSRCFQENDQITCNTCHDSHREERGDLAAFSARCATCHDPEVCGKHGQLGAEIQENCIDCHMPFGEAPSVAMAMPGGFQAPLIRDHFIAKHPKATRQFLDRRSQRKNGRT